MEPVILSNGKKFHKRVQKDWEKYSKDGVVSNETVVGLFGKWKGKKGRMDIFVDELGDFVSVVEIKSTDWDKIKEKNRMRLLGSHQRQVWKYVEKYLEEDKVDVCPGIIYPRAPKKAGLREKIETYLNDYGLQVVWYDE